DAATNAFRPAGRDLPADPDDVLIRANGDLWWIDLLKAVHGPHATFPIRSSSYPGRDPRHLVEDARGGLWVVDFESGLFRLGDTGGFVHEPGLDDKGSGVAVDAERGRTWLLHYTKGLVLKVDGAPPHPFDLSDLEYMRDLMLDPDGSVWVAGWNKLLHLRDTPQGWKRNELIAR